jgi:hypothetical protein
MSKLITLRVLLAFLVLVSTTVSGGGAAGGKTKAAAQSNYVLRTHVMGATGAPTLSPGLRSNGTLGQPTPIGVGTTASQTLHAGYWGQVWLRTPVGITRPTIYKNELFQNYPNPFNPSTTVEYSVAGASAVEIKIFNVRGQLIKTLVSGDKLPGRHRVTWDGKNDVGIRVASGVYFYRIRIGRFSHVKKLVLLK